MRYVALLRGINVGGKNTVPMARLKELFEHAGHTGVRTYINSGNVVFDGPRRKVTDVAAGIEAAIEEEFGFATRVLVLRGSTITAIAEALPEHWVNDDTMKSDVLYLLPEVASPKALEPFEGGDPEREEAFYVQGAIASRVDRSFSNRGRLHKLAGTKAYLGMTIRNVNTARKLAAMVEGE